MKRQFNPWTSAYRDWCVWMWGHRQEVSRTACCSTAHRNVFAVDVGYGQLAWQLRQDSRVTPIERTNIRHMPEDRLPLQIDLATIDVSFISLKIVVPQVLKFMKPSGRILALIKTAV